MRHKPDEKPRVKNLPILGDRHLPLTMLEIAKRHDIEVGGHYDGRSACINFWCSPSNKPSCWAHHPTKGAFAYERDYVGLLGWEWPTQEGEHCEFYIEVSPYEMGKTRELTDFSGVTEEEWQALLRWCEDQAEFLFRRAIMPPGADSYGCPWCSFHLAPSAFFGQMMAHVNDRHGIIEYLSFGRVSFINLASKKSGRIPFYKKGNNKRPKGV